MKEHILKKKGLRLTWLLRHDKESFEKGIIDEHGWRPISELVSKHDYFSTEIIDEIVKTNNKQRFEYNDTKTHIRARQGHSIPVDVELKEIVPPDVLYHGTAEEFLKSIKEYGVKKQTRLYVHLSIDVSTALNVGIRHSDKPIVLVINAKQMYMDGCKFYISNNGVYLTDYVAPKYIM